MTNYSNDLKLECSKNMTIGDAVGIEVKVMSDFISTSVNFFTPEGQVVLMEKINDLYFNKDPLINKFINDSKETGISFIVHAGTLYTDTEIIAETKLAELFYEFIENQTQEELDHE